MSVAVVRFENVEDGHLIMRFEGKLDLAEIGDLWDKALMTLRADKINHLTLDLEKVGIVDTAGATLLHKLKQHCSEEGISVTEKNIPPSVQQFLEYIQKHSPQKLDSHVPAEKNLVAHLGERVQAHLIEARSFVRFLGEFLSAAASRLLRPHTLHFREILYHTQMVGVGAVPLLVSLSLLLGMLMVFQGMNSVRSFGADIYIADMVVISVTREMGPLLTAVVLSGRTGAAYAAELGTMKINQELDALAVMDLDVTHFLVLPRVFALMIADPLLTMISNAAGILGGLVTSYVVLGLSFESFLLEAQKTLSADDIYTGLIKGFTFGAFIGLIGCFKGWRTGMGASSVGIQTTSAVVTCIFLVIFFDTLFSYIFQLYGW